MNIRNIFQLILACFILCQLFAFTPKPEKQSTDYITEDNPPRKEKIIKNPDIDPMYPGGKAAMMQFISSQLRYPRKCVESNEQGLVVYNFVVETDGSLSNFELMHRAHPLLNEEALRIIKRMPAWRPAKYRGKFVRAKKFVPMYFRLKKRNNASRSFSQNQALPQQKKKPNNSYNEKNIYKPKAPVLKPKNDEVKYEEVYTIVDQIPQFPSGETGLHKFIGKYMEYPIDAHQAGIEGRILCAFIVDKEGAISHIEIVQGLYPSLDDEAMRVLSIMPRWKPGVNKGERVNVKCILPFDFTIREAPIAPME